MSSIWLAISFTCGEVVTPGCVVKNLRGKVRIKPNRRVQYKKVKK